MRRFLQVVFFAALISGSAFTQAGFKIKTRTTAELAAAQRQLVGSYCRGDFDGQRLTDEGWAKMQQLVRNKRNSEFAVIQIISRYGFNPPSDASITVPVTYNVIGRYEMGYGYAPSSGTHVENFRVEEKEGELIITDSPATPFVSKRAMVQWLRNELAKPTTSAVQKTQMQTALDALEPAAAK